MDSACWPPTNTTKFYRRANLSTYGTEFRAMVVLRTEWLAEFLQDRQLEKATGIMHDSRIPDDSKGGMHAMETVMLIKAQ